MIYAKKLLSVLILILVTSIVYAESTFSTFSSDTIFPKKIVIEGRPAIAYSMEQDKFIITVLEERELLYGEIYACEALVDSFRVLVNLYKEDVLTMGNIIDAQESNIKTLKKQRNVFEQKYDIRGEQLDLYKLEVKALQNTQKKTKKKNNILFTTGGIILTGLIVYSIIKSL